MAGVNGSLASKKKKFHIVFLQWVPVAMRQPECHLVQGVLNLYSLHIALHVRFILYQEATLPTSCRTVVRSMYRSSCSGACCDCARQHACTAFLCFWMCGTPVRHRQTKRGDGCVPGGGMILPSNMLRLQKGDISCMEKPQAVDSENI